MADFTQKSDWIWLILPLLFIIIFISIIIAILKYRRSDGTSKKEKAMDKDEFDIEAEEKGDEGGLEDKLIEDELEDEELKEDPIEEELENGKSKDEKPGD
jgi:flagellar biosynthesis/type III secretory pathway M-ring protein FliF/YscJ